mmetsp:Transcript_37564/g.91128  ORF Transcript_37564/g.91128 Transcript_37564/m.91128 type:complete len:291 (-) Transcript_37564:69-941(-)
MMECHRPPVSHFGIFQAFIYKTKLDSITSSSYITIMKPWNLLSSCLVLPSASLEGQMGDKYSGRITDQLTLRQELPSICQDLFEELGSQQLEGTYQRCLAIDLLQAGVEEVHTEVKLPLTYKGKVVGNRRADMVLDLASGERAIIELKAIEKMWLMHRVQLEYYMYHADIEEGYLINFPHDDGFPSVTGNCEFEYKALIGDTYSVQHLVNNRSRLTLRNTPDNRDVEVIHIRRSDLVEETEGTTVSGLLGKVIEEILSEYDTDVLNENLNNILSDWNNNNNNNQNQNLPF